MKFHALTVRDIIHETADAFTIKMEKPSDPAFDYKAGQYLTIRADVHGSDERRAYSLSSSPSVDDYLSVTIKTITDGRLSNYLKNTLEAGDTLEAFPPMGKFVLEPDAAAARHHILIGGGSGITPIMSMIKTVLNDEPKSSLTLIYGNSTENDIIFRQQLEDLQQAHPNRLKVVHFLSRCTSDWAPYRCRFDVEHGTESIQTAIDSSDLPTEFYLCGPNGLMETAAIVLKDKLGIAEARIHKEFYSAPVPDAAQSADAAEITGQDGTNYEVVDQKVQIHLEGETFEIDVPAGTVVLDAALDAGYDPPYACQEGVCCTCRARVHSGTVSMDEREGLSDEEIAEGYVLTCQSRPLTDDVELEYC